MSEPGDITRILEAATRGDTEAFGRVVALTYEQLVRLANRQMRGRFGRLEGLTLEPSALVHETLLKLLPEPRSFANRRHFFAFAAKVMRRVLIDYQRARQRGKRGGGALRVTLSELGEADATTPELGALQVFELLARLEGLDARKSEVVNLKVVWGFEMTEIAQILDVSLSTVERDWRFCRSWLARELELV